MKNTKSFISYRSLFVALLCAILLMSCGTKRKTANRNSTKSSQTSPRKVNNNTEVSSIEKSLPEDNSTIDKNIKPVFNNPVEAYIWHYSDIAQEEMRLYGIPASITIAQGILESGSGNGNLTLRSNNHFGIKCNGWKGEKVYHDDDELQECFRKYKDPKYSFRDHSLFLYERPRYAFLFDYDVTDYKSWANGLRRAGYATDRKYPDKLISLIERYFLHELDSEVTNGVPPPNFPEPKNKIDYTLAVYTVKAEDTLYKIASKYNLTVDELKQFNQLRNDVIRIGQKINLKTIDK